MLPTEEAHSAGCYQNEPGQLKYLDVVASRRPHLETGPIIGSGTEHLSTNTAA